MAAEGISSENAVHFPRHPQKWRGSREFCSIWLEFHLQVKMRRIYNLFSETDSLNWLVWEEYFQLGPKSAILDPATSIKFVVTALENATLKAGKTRLWLSALISCATLEFTRPEPRHSRQDSAPAVTSVGVLCLYILYYLLFNLLFFW